MEPVYREVLMGCPKGVVPWNKGLKTGPLSVVTRDKISKSMIGNTNSSGNVPWSRGNKLPEETRNKIAGKLRGRKLTIETRSLMSEVRKGRPHSERHRLALSVSRRRQVLPTKDTSIEVKIQHLLEDHGVIYSKHLFVVSGQVDIFIEPNIVIECDGCYWHGCQRCHPESHRRKWDNVKESRLRSSGYIVIRLWEHEINQSIESCWQKIHSALER